MAKFTLVPLNPNDPFGNDKPVVVDVPEHSPAPRAFPLAASEFIPWTPQASAAPDPLGYFDAPASPALRFEKFNLVPVTRGDDFAGLGDGTATRSTDFGKITLATEESYFDLPATSTPPAPDAGFTKGVAGQFVKFTKFQKLEDTANGPMVWGVATLEEPDLDNEICSYDDAVEAYKAWSQAAYKRTADAGQEPSLGNVRLQHSTEIGGKVVKVDYDDENKRIMLGTVPFNDQVLADLRKGYYTGYSQGGSYAWRNCADCGNSLPLQQANNFCQVCKKSGPVRFGLKRLSEVSYVDSPCTGQGFEYVKANGSSEIVNFSKRAPRPSADVFEILSTERITRKISKCVAMIGNRKRTILVWPDGHLVFEFS